MNLTPLTAARITGRPWAIAPGRMEGLLGGALALTPGAGPPSWLQDVARSEPYTVTDSGIAVVPVLGPLVSRGDWLTLLLGASEYGTVAHAVRAAANDPAVSGVLLEVDSPGGEVGGLFDLVEEVAAIRARCGKPLWAVASECALSAAYAIASAAGRLYVTRTGEVGSVGVVAVHLDESGASADAQISKCTYTGNTTDDRLEIAFDAAGTSGNSFTLAASANSNGTVSAPTLTGGGYMHEWLSGGDAIPSYTFEIGHPQLITPVFFRHLGTVMESLAFEMGREGPANGTVQLVAQGEEKAVATIDPAPQSFALKRFSQGRGFITRGGVALAGVTGGSLTVSNNLERVRVIRDDGKIEAAEPTIATCTGAMTVRFDGATLVAEATNGEPVSLAYGFTMAEGWDLSFELFRVFLPKPKYAVSGPGGVEASFDWRAATEESTGTMLRVRLLNDVASYG